MNVRRIVSHESFKDNLSFEWNFSGLANNLHWNTNLYTNLNFFLFIILISLVLGWIWPTFFLAALSCAGLLCFQFLKVRKLANGLSIHRSVPNMARENTKIEVVYTVSNETSFPIEGVGFREDFNGLQAGHYLVNLNRVIPALTQFKHVQKIQLNGGMGVKVFDPFSIILKDELGIFSFKISFTQKSSIEVYPVLEETPALKTSISPDTINYGFYEVPKKGDSNLFIGTRNYRQGDPVKHINWKLSQKTQKIIVNEYEKNTNSYVTLLIDLHLDNQSGSGKNSTWEAAKDLALSICANEIKKNNQIQVLSNNLHIPWGSGRNQLNILEQHFTHHELENTKDTNHLRHLYDLPTQSQVYYIFPKITSAKVLETIEVLMQLRIMGHKVLIFAVDPYDYLIGTVKDQIRLGILTMDTHIQAEFNRIKQRLTNADIHLVNIEIKETIDLNRQIIKNAMEFLE